MTCLGFRTLLTGRRLGACIDAADHEAAAPDTAFERNLRLLRMRLLQTAFRSVIKQIRHQAAKIIIIERQTAAVSTTADTTTSASVTGTTETQESVTTATTQTAPPAVEDSRGDINADSEISVADAQLALNAYVKRMAGSETGLTAEQAQAADVNRDREISVDDAQTILMYYVKNSLSHIPTSWEDLLEKKQPAKLPKAIKRK